MIIQLELNHEAARKVPVNNRGEFIFNMSTGRPSTLDRDFGNNIYRNKDDKFPMFKTGRTFPPLKGKERLARNYSLSHYGVTVVRDNERLVTVSDGRRSTFYYLKDGEFKDIRSNEGCYSVEEAHQLLIKSVIVSNMYFSKEFREFAFNFIRDYVTKVKVVEVPAVYIPRDEEDGNVGGTVYLGFQINEQGGITIYNLGKNPPKDVNNINWDDYPVIPMEGLEGSWETVEPYNHDNGKNTIDTLIELDESMGNRAEEEEEVADEILDEEVNGNIADSSEVEEVADDEVTLDEANVTDEVTLDDQLRAAIHRNPVNIVADLEQETEVGNNDPVEVVEPVVIEPTNYSPTLATDSNN